MPSKGLYCFPTQSPTITKDGTCIRIALNQIGVTRSKSPKETDIIFHNQEKLTIHKSFDATEKKTI